MAESSELDRDKSKEMDAIKGAPASPKHIAPPAGFTLLHTFEGQRSRGPAIWSPDGKLLAFVGSDGAIRLWDPISGRFLDSCKGPGRADSYVYVACESLTVCKSFGYCKSLADCWSFEFGEIESPGDWIHSLVWAPDGKLLTFGPGRTMRLWNPITGKLLHTLESLEGDLRSVAWSPDGKLLAIARYDMEERHREDEPGYQWFSYGGTVEVWDVINGVLLDTFENPVDFDFENCGPQDWIGSLSWSSDSQWLAFVSSHQSLGNEVRLWNSTKGLHPLEDRNDVDRLAWSPDGKLLTITDSQSIWLWDPISGEQQQGYHPYGIEALAWSPDGKLLASFEQSYSANDSGVRLWNMTKKWHWPHPDTLESDYRHDDPCALAWSPDSKLLAIAGSRTLQLWEVKQEWGSKPLRALEGYTMGSRGEVQSLVWSPDGKLLASSFYTTSYDDEFRCLGEEVKDMDIYIWHTDTGQLLEVLTDLERSGQYAWHPSLPLLVTAGQQKEDLLIWQWDLAHLSHHAPSSEIVHSILHPTVTQAANILVGNQTVVRDLQAELEETSSKRATTQNIDECSQLEYRIHELETALQQKREETNQLRMQLEQQQGSFLRTEEHHAALEQAITEAKEELIIISPWLHPRVCDEALCRLIAGAVKRGVQVRIGYGFTERPGTSGAVHQRTNAMHVIRALKTAVKREGTFTSGGKLDIQRISDTHQKILICDRLYAILGSFNWLSYRGELDTEYRKETSIVLRDPSKIAELARVAMHMWPS